MAYVALARRYRSRSFDDLIGQEPIARTLKNAIETNRVAHGYIFTGTRGVGKTSAARIFAKELNGGTPEIDDIIMQGRDTDVIEIDAASNNSVDNARELIANSSYRPMRAPYKIYIIDEVHMLSNAAFNALLKTMEEPPEHVKFILCTTEIHKVPATIQSRCQRFDFKNIPTAEIAKHLASVIQKEKHTAEPELIHEIARIADGSMRDGLSLLDRLMAAGEKKLTLKLLEDLLGLPDRSLITKLITSFADGNTKTALEMADELLSRGVSIDQLFEAVLMRLRDLLIIAACGADTKVIELSDANRAAEIKLASRFDGAGLVHMIALCETSQRNAKHSTAPRALLDAVIARLAMSEKIADVTALARELAGGKALPAGAASKK